MPRLSRRDGRNWLALARTKLASTQFDGSGVQAMKNGDASHRATATAGGNGTAGFAAACNIVVRNGPG
ncbi:MAG: hypothetical protein LH470_02800 [Lysobacter sp.]|nr:hypothetical protein [Lysobacter sp.]